MNSSRLLQLASRFIANDLSRTETNQMSRALAANPGFADELRCQVAMDSMMRIRFSNIGERASWASVARRLSEEAQGRRIGFGRILRLGLPLAAAAAALLVAVRLFLLPGPDALPEFRIVQQIGPVTVTESSVITGPDAYCHVAFRDGTVLALDQRTDMRFGDANEDGSKTWTHASGRIYVATPLRAHALAIRSGDARFEILGTRLEIGHGPVPRVSVFEGKVHAAYGEAAILVHAGQTARMTPLADGRRRFIDMQPIDIADNALAWLRKLEIPMDETLALAQSAPSPIVHPQIDSRHALVLSGEWRIDAVNDNAAIRQRSARPGEHMIQLGHARWDRALLTYKFRIDKISAPDYGVGALFYDETRAYHSFTSKRGLREYREAGHTGWMVVRQEFERMPNGRIVLRLWELWPEEAPRKKSSAKDWLGDPSYLFKTPLGIGFVAENCSVEFADIEIRPVR